MLVVVVIIGILASTIVLGFVGSDREQNLRTEAERLAELIEMARSEAVQRNEEWGLAIGATGYRFLVLDSITHRWVEQKNGPFHPRETPDMTLSVQVDALTMPGANAEGDYAEHHHVLERRADAVRNRDHAAMEIDTVERQIGRSGPAERQRRA